MAGYRPVSPAEAIKWRVENPMKVSLCVSNEEVVMKLQFNNKTGGFEVYDMDAWAEDVLPGDPAYTYYIPEVTE